MISFQRWKYVLLFSDKQQKRQRQCVCVERERNGMKSWIQRKHQRTAVKNEMNLKAKWQSHKVSEHTISRTKRQTEETDDARFIPLNLKNSNEISGCKRWLKNMETELIG